MNRRPNTPKCILGVVMVALLVVGGWATTITRSTNTKTTASTIAATAAHPSASVSPRSTGTDPVTDQIELDGDIIDSPLGSPDDWDTINCNGGGSAFVKTFVHDGENVSIFTQGGSKDINDVSAWRNTDGSVPPKDELSNAYAAKYVGPTGDTILAFGADRVAVNGTAFLGVWFFKNAVSVVPPVSGTTGTFSGVHSIGDVLVLSTFTNGGSIATSKVFEWVGTGGDQKQGTLQDITATAPAGSVFSISNSTVQTIPASCLSTWQYTPQNGNLGDPIPVNGFFEGAINISAFPALGNECFSSFLVETRSSADVDAQLKDFVTGSFNTCVSLEVTKTASVTEACAGTPVSYTYTVHNLSPIAITVNLVDDNGTPGNEADDVDVDGGAGVSLAADDQASGGADQTTFTSAAVILPVGTTTNTVTATGTGLGDSATATAQATVIINSNPTCSVNNAERCSDGPAQTLTVTPSGGTPGYTFSWTGPGGFTAGNVSSISVTVAGTYTVFVTDSKGCTTTCSGTLTVNPPPIVSVSTVACSTASSISLTATASGGSGAGFTFSWTGPGGFTSTNQTITASATGTFTVIVTDSRGCTGTASRIVGLCAP
jgi:hypothetical protein